MWQASARTTPRSTHLNASANAAVSWVRHPVTQPWIEVAVVDAHRGFRESLARLIRESTGFQLVGAYDSVSAALSENGLETTAVLLMDVQRPDAASINGIRQLQALRPDLAVVMLTTFDDSDLVIESLRAGAAGYLLKGSAEEDILGAIRAVAAGGSAMSGPVARMVIRTFVTPARPAAEDLPFTSREQELLDFLAEGLRYKEVADRMGIALNTVRFHVRSVYGKLGAQSRTEALRKYRELCAGPAPGCSRLVA